MYTTVCPNTCVKNSLLIINKNKINKQSQISSSQSLYKKKAFTVSQHVGECANPTHLLQSGGPGNHVSSKQKITTSNTYRLPVNKVRTANKNNIGVDKKHNSYDRYLARKVGGLLRKEIMPNIIGKDDAANTLGNCFKTNCCDNRIKNTTC